MILYSMTATFGKLEGKTLELRPGLNVIQAPNEWGKSTWCEFLLAMLYGVPTRDRSKTGYLAVKDRYAPWSGSPMSGQLRICWEGRDITIERSSTPRVPLGKFRAYETASGLELPELTGENCGRVLLGVEQSVYRRSGFLRLQDLPVTQDEALLRRLRDLVTTGDDSGSADILETQLKKLKNKIRHNRTGLLPQLQGEILELERVLEERNCLRQELEELSARLEEEKRREAALQTHGKALEYALARQVQERLQEAREQLTQGEQTLEALALETSRLPSREKIREKLEKLETLTRDQAALSRELQTLPPEPLPPGVPEPYAGENPSAALAADDRALEQLNREKPWLWYVGAAVLAALGLGLLLGSMPLAALAALAAGAILLLPGALAVRKKNRGKKLLEDKYGSLDPDRWRRELESCRRTRRRYGEELAAWRSLETELERRSLELQTRWDSLCASQEPRVLMALWNQALGRWDALDNARQSHSQWQQYLHRLEEVGMEAEPVPMDDLPYDREETARRLEQACKDRKALEDSLNRLQGRYAAGEGEKCLDSRLVWCRNRARELEEKEAAVGLALEALTQAREDLQRRFAPRIIRQAKTILGRLTGGRYDRLTWDPDMTLHSAAGEETVTRPAAVRSDGTADQMYLALRLAVARELIPQAPLVLDDALVRFDDTRLKAALELLEEEGQTRQVILFTCQSRENRLL